MKAHYYLWLALFAFILVASCQKAPELSISGPTTVEISADGNSASITFTTNRDWTVISSATWMTITPSSGTASNSPITIYVSCRANDTFEDRSGTITIKAEDLTQTITVKQTENLGVILPKQVYEVPPTESTIDIDLKSNIKYTVSISSDWIKQIGTKGLIPYVLTIGIDENKSVDAREGNIIIKPQGSGVQEQMISIKQAGYIYVSSITLNQTNLLLREGATATLAATILPDNATDKTVNWSSSDTKTVSVDNKGTVSAIQEGTAIVTAQAGGKKATCSIVVKATVEAVDLGLSVKWASCNLGALEPEEYGNYYAWGETEPKSDYSWNTYKWCNGNSYSLTKYNTSENYGKTVDNKTQLELEDDAAHVKLGGSWRIPTYEELLELVNNCKLEHYLLNDVPGLKITSKVNENYIFLPCTRERGWSMSYTFPFGCYWVSTLAPSPDEARDFEFDYMKSIWLRETSARCYGYTVRPVTK